MFYQCMIKSVVMWLLPQTHQERGISGGYNFFPAIANYMVCLI